MRRSPRDGDATRKALVDAATRLFAEQGIDGVSIRSINSAAGLGPAAIHYHFGSKDGLLRAVLEQDGAEVLSRVEEEEQRLLERRSRPRSRELVEVVGLPYLELLRRDPVRGSRWLKIIAELSQADDERIVEFAGSATDNLRELARRAFPDASEEHRLTCIPIALISLLVLMSRAAHAAGPNDLDDHVAVVFAFVATGLDAAIAAGASGRGTRTRGSRADAAKDAAPPRPTRTAASRR